MPNLLGIDLGTSSVKALVYDTDANTILGVAAQEYGIDRPQPEWAQQDPAQWWQGMVGAVRGALEKAGAVAIRALSFSGQMHGTVLVNKAGVPVHPAIIWADTRSEAQLAPLVAAVGENDFIATTGTLPAVGFMGPTLLWLAAHLPDVLASADKALLPKDYIRLKLTGEAATEPTDAAGTALFDIRARGWATGIIAAAGLPPGLFPPVINSHAVAGDLLPAAADALGLPPGIPVVAGCADQPAQALGNGVVAPGKVSLTVGSGGQVFAPVATPVPGARYHVFNHAVPGGYYGLGAMLSAGLSLRWLRDLLNTDYATLSQAAAAVPAGADGLLFLPYLGGERTPHMDPLARGAFVGLTAAHDVGHMARAVMEGVAFAMRQALTTVTEMPETIIGSGGGVESAVWRGILTDVLGRPLRKSLETEQAALGAALLAGVGAGHLPGFAALEERAAYDLPTHPTDAHRALYADRYAQFCQLYPRLKADFHQLAGKK